MLLNIVILRNSLSLQRLRQIQVAVPNIGVIVTCLDLCLPIRATTAVPYPHFGETNSPEAENIFTTVGQETLCSWDRTYSLPTVQSPSLL